MRFSWKKTLGLGLSMLAVALAAGAGCPGTVSGPVLYVKADATGLRTGGDWANALTEIQDATLLASQNSGITEIWVAAGTYHPTSIGGDRTIAYRLRNNLAIYGGFAGTETSRDQRDPAVNLTILSGDLKNDDNGSSNLSDNSYHVVIADSVDSSAILDGFIIRGGYASDGNNVSGAGMYCQNASPTLTHCTFESNAAASNGAAVVNQNSSPTFASCIFTLNTALGAGGAMYNASSAPVLVNCQFSSNTAPTAGAIANLSNSQLTASGCTFTSNASTDAAGAVLNSSGSAAFTDCTFESNASALGGAVENVNSSAPVFTRCAFRGNAAQQDGGAVLNTISVLARLTGCTFESNSAGRSGGGVSNVSGSDAVLMNCRFAGNSALNGGGGIFNFVSNPSLTNCVFTGNTGGVGGAIHNRDNSAPIVTNCTFSLNEASLGGAIYNALQASPVITNSIFWGNEDSGNSPSAAQIRTDSGAPVVNYSCVQGGWTGAGGTGNISSDPLFVNAAGPDGKAGTADEDLGLQPTSPCIDAGNNAAVPADSSDLNGNGNTSEPVPLDVALNPRFVDDPQVADTGSGSAPLVDMGALEYQP